MKKVLLVVLLLAFAAAAFAQTPPAKTAEAAAQKATAAARPATSDLTEYGVRIEPDKRLIVVMAALEAAGLESTLSESGQSFRQQLKVDLANVDPAVKQKMAAFIKQYRDRHPNASTAEMTAPFVSLAYALGPVPDLTAPARTSDLPADLLEVLDFAPFVREFYQSAKMDAKLPAYVQLYQIEGEKMRFSSGEMVKSLLDYLHTRPELTVFDKTKTQVPDPKNLKKMVAGIRTTERDRKFFIVPDLLAASGTVNFRNIGDDYYVVVPPGTNLLSSEARRGYLQFVLDPLILKNGKDIAQFREGIKSLLDEQRKSNPNISPDVFLAVMRSMVAAADAREIEYQRVQYLTDVARRDIARAQGEAAKKAVATRLAADKQVYADETALDLSNAYERGAVLAFYFADQLKALEDSGFDISSSLREMIATLDASKEKSRLSLNTEARKRALVAREERKKQSLVNVERAKLLKGKLDEVEVVTRKKEYAESETLLKNLLNEYPEEASIYYALGRVASLSAEGTFDEGLRDKRLEDAKLHYSNAIRKATGNTDPALIQLSYVALGRIYEFYDDLPNALQIYQAALRFNKANEAAFNEANSAVARLTAPKKQ